MRRTVLNVFWCCAALLLAACVARDPLVTFSEPPKDRELTLAPGEKVAVIADAESRNNGDIPSCVREKLQEAMPGLELVPPSDFRTMVGFRFSTTPTAANSIAAVLTDPTVKETSRRLELRYLIIVGGTTEAVVTGGGYYETKKTSYIHAEIWDVPAAEHIGEFSSHASGVYDMIGFAYTPTETAACERVTKSLAERLG